MAAQITVNAFVLHSRSYQDRSLLLDLLSTELGLIRVVAKGARNKSKKNALRCDPYTRLQVSLSGRSALKTLRSSEALTVTYRLEGERLFAAMYVNELMLRVLHEGDPIPEVFWLYEAVLIQLAGEKKLELILRPFELQLLELLGYGIDFSVDIDGQSISSNKLYDYLPEHGFQLNEGYGRKNSFTGLKIKALAEGDFANSDCRRDAKLLLRLALSPLVGDKPFMSRELFIGVQAK